MSQQMYRLELPPEVIEQIRDLARRQQRPVEDVIAESLSLLFGAGAPIDPEVMTTLADKQLWMLVHERLEPDKRERLHVLLEKNQDAPLAGAEASELNALRAEVEHQAELRVEALALLRSRGHDIQSYLTSHPT